MSHIRPDILGRSRVIFILGVLVLITAYMFEAPPFGVMNLKIVTPQNEIGTYYRVNRVTDGDTIHIDMDGKDEVVRLIGINTPETVDPRRPVQCFGKEANERMEDIVGGKIVRLEYDDTQDTRDSYGRILAYVFLEDGEMVNRKMIAEGYAYEYTYMTPYRYRAEFRQLQTLARSSERGLWAPDTCDGKTTLSN